MDDNHSQPSLEESWSDAHEDFVEDIQKKAKILSERHDELGKLYRFRHRAWSVPSILIPIGLTPASPFISSFLPVAGPIIITVGFFLSGSCAAVLGLMEYSQRSERHFAFSSRYTDLDLEIATILTRRRPFRPEADVFLNQVKNTLERLQEAEPTV